MKKIFCKHLKKRNGLFYVDYHCKLKPDTIENYHKNIKEVCKECPRVLELFSKDNL